MLPTQKNIFTPLDKFLAEELEKLKKQNLYRELKLSIEKSVSKEYISFGSNDYLGFAETIGSSGSRLTSGTHAIHLDLEKYVAEWKKTESAIVFGSGYLANVGTLSALLGPKDVAYADSLNHACIFDGIRLSKAKKYIYQHNDTSHLENLLLKTRRKSEKSLIVTDSVFSMDGDKAKLAELVKLSKIYDCSIYLDEAHATGVLGCTGAGLLEECVEKHQFHHKDIDVQMGTFSKAIGAEGAYVAGSRDLIDYLRNKARTFIFSTAPSPFVMEKVFKNLKENIQNPSLRRHLHDNISQLRRLFFENPKFIYGYPSDDKFSSQNMVKNIFWTNEETAIFAIFVGDLDKTLEISHKLQNHGILIPAIRPPTVDKPRLRVCVSAANTHEQLDKLVRVLSDQC